MRFTLEEKFNLEDIPEIEKGESLHVEIEYVPGAAILKRKYYILNKDNVGTPEKPAIRVYDSKISKQYLEPVTVELHEVLEFNIIKPD